MSRLSAYVLNIERLEEYIKFRNKGARKYSFAQLARDTGFSECYYSLLKKERKTRLISNVFMATLESVTGLYPEDLFEKVSIEEIKGIDNQPKFNYLKMNGENFYAQLSHFENE